MRGKDARQRGLARAAGPADPDGAATDAPVQQLRGHLDGLGLAYHFGEGMRAVLFIERLHMMPPYAASAGSDAKDSAVSSTSATALQRRSRQSMQADSGDLPASLA